MAPLRASKTSLIVGIDSRRRLFLEGLKQTSKNVVTPYVLFTEAMSTLVSDIIFKQVC